MELGEHLGLGQCNLTRVLNMMSAAGLVEHSTHGREAIFELLRAGEAARAGMRLVGSAGISYLDSTVRVGFLQTGRPRRYALLAALIA